MQSDLKAIETRWNGYRFRSRLEARWSVFFTELGIKFYYEREGFDLDGEPYLPDFHIPDFELNEIKGTWQESAERCFYVEIKPTRPTQAELIKAAKLAKHTGMPVLLVSGEPYEECYQMLLIRKTKKTGRKNFIIEGTMVDRIHEEKAKKFWWFVLAQWARINDLPNALIGYSGISKAYTEARSARFEHQERATL